MSTEVIDVEQPDNNKCTHRFVQSTEHNLDQSIERTYVSYFFFRNK